MSSKPHDYYVTMFDFFSVLLPGVILLYVLDINFGSLGAALPSVQNMRSLGHYLFLAVTGYIIGHYIYASGSFLDRVYDKWRKRFYDTRCQALFEEAKARVKSIENKPIITPYKWCKSFVEINAFEQSQVIVRLDSISKLFRSLVVLTLFLFASSLIRGNFGIAAIFLFGSLLSFWRYANQRRNRDDLAYMYFLHFQSGKPIGNGS